MLVRQEVNNELLSLSALTIIPKLYEELKSKRINAIVNYRNTNSKFKLYLKQTLKAYPSQRELRNFLNREADNATIDLLYRKTLA